eukprot:11720644-Alexandrium_andersonii.AAC.1
MAASAAESSEDREAPLGSRGGWDLARSLSPPVGCGAAAVRMRCSKSRCTPSAHTSAPGGSDACEWRGDR